jgi:hypothetical protein
MQNRADAKSFIFRVDRRSSKLSVRSTVPIVDIRSTMDYELRA